VNWKLILQLSLFGLAMAIGTVFVIPSNIEPLCWLGVFLVCAYLIAAHAPGRYFVHGLFVGIANSVWVTSAHVLLVDRYLANHPREADMMTSMPWNTHPRMLMAMMGPVVGVISGTVLGVLALVAGKLTRRN
jgi:hypothetical protein